MGYWESVERLKKLAIETARGRAKSRWDRDELAQFVADVKEIGSVIDATGTPAATLAAHEHAISYGWYVPRPQWAEYLKALGVPTAVATMTAKQWERYREEVRQQVEAVHEDEDDFECER